MQQTPLMTQAPVSYQHISAAGTVVVKTAPGALMSVNVNGITAASTATLLDQTGTTVGTVDIGILTLGTAVPIQNLAMGPAGIGVAFANGLVVVTTGTCDLTIGYR